MKIRVMVCEDIKAIREYVVSSIRKDSEIEVVGEASSGAEAVLMSESVKPDVILMDIQMEYETAGIDAIHAIYEKHPDIKIIVLTVHNDDELIMDAYYAGAMDYIIKTSAESDICGSIKRVYREENFIGPLIAKNLRTEVRKMRKSEESLLFFIHESRLTATEKELLKLFYLGYSKKKISEMRSIEVSTIKVHVKHILKKLNYSSTSELISFLKKIKIYEMFDL